MNEIKKPWQTKAHSLVTNYSYELLSSRAHYASFGITKLIQKEINEKIQIKKNH